MQEKKKGTINYNTNQQFTRVSWLLRKGGSKHSTLDSVIHLNYWVVLSDNIPILSDCHNDLRRRGGEEERRRYQKCKREHVTESTNKCS